ncbi:MAG: FHA domain-containing protein [Flavobacteriaceae bacterium]|nr:FHA domain-containing protein [Flavobacteriaceae bacterium]
MKGFNECSNGHFYDNNLKTCPYCPNTGERKVGSLDKTIIEGETFDQTIIEAPNYSDKTIVDNQEAINEPAKDLSKTYIKTDDVVTDDAGAETVVLRERRKLVGWLVSYTIDSLGRDYRIYEGRNTIGANTSNDIILNTDASVSKQHAILLFRNNNFYLKDNLSTNSTKLNGKDIEPDTSVKFNDKAIIEIGNTKFLFKTSF